MSLLPVKSARFYGALHYRKSDFPGQLHHQKHRDFRLEEPQQPLSLKFNMAAPFINND